MNHYDALKLIALGAVMKPDSDANYRSICRWYSITFHTPLHTVEDLPEDEVLSTYYEATYEEMAEEDRKDLLKTLTETPEEKRQRLLAKDAAETEAFEFTRQLAYEEKQKQAKAKLSDVKVTQKPSMFNPVAKDVSLVSPKIAPAFEKLEPDVAIKFVDADEFEKELEGFGAMSPKEAK